MKMGTSKLCRLFRHDLLLGTALVIPALAAPALAQDQAPAPASAQGETYQNEILVTAQRRTERLEDVPMTVTALSGDNLSSVGIDSMRDLSKVVTGLQIATSGAFPAPAIRGVTALTNGTSFENNVALYVDGFYEPASQVINIDLPNLEGVQVLKGPQGTLYGRNATGGAILLSTVTPKDHWEGKAELIYARFDDKRASAYVAGPLSDVFGVSAAGYIRRSDGYIKLTSRTTPGALDGNATPLEQDSIRVKLKGQFGENFSAILAYNYTHTSDARGNQFTPFENLAAKYATNPAANTRATQLGTAAWDYDSRVETWTHQGTLTMSLDAGFGTIKSYTGFTSTKPVTSYDFDGSYINEGWATSVFRQKTFQQAIDVTSKPLDNLDLIVGATYFNDTVRSIDIANYTPCHLVVPIPAGCVITPPTQPQPFSNLVKSPSSVFRQKKEAWGFYLDATWQPTDALSITLGGRYSTESQYVFASSATFPATDKGSSYRKFTPRAAIRYELAPRTNVYFTYQQGFRSGAWNASLPATPAQWIDVKQEVVDAFEIGFKTARNKFRFELAGFYYNFKGLQVSVTQCIDVGLPACQVTQVIANAPPSKIYGIEGSFEWQPIENFTVRGGASWVHARYGDGFVFNTVGVNPTQIGAGGFSDPLKNYLNQTQAQNLSGQRMSRAPDFTANLALDYNIPDRDGGLRFAANLYYTSKYVLRSPAIWCEPLASNSNCAGIAPEVQRQQRFLEGPYALLSASITWTHPSGHYYLKAWGNNLTDRRYRMDANGSSATGTYTPMAEPRTYGATIGAKF